jgi:glycosyltransferase involved in cell wall biosynthesis
MLWFFWLSLAFIAYTMAGYAAILWLLARLFPRTRIQAEFVTSVSVLIAVRGGEELLARKIENCLDQDYPSDKVEIAVICDGPQPLAEEIALRYSRRGVRLLRAEHKGKTHSLAVGLAATFGEIVIFTDVSVTMDRHAIRTLLENFADPRVGCVSSEDATRPAEGNAEPVYASFDSRLRRMEGAVRTLIGASGSLFAARRETCLSWPEGLSSDFFVPLQCIESGMDVVVDPRVRGYLGTVKAKDELRRKVRTIVHGLDVLFSYLHLLNPFVYGMVAWELISHKLFRWLLPLAFAAVFVSNVFLWNFSDFFRMTLIMQCLFYLAGVAARFSGRALRFSPVKVASFVVIGNLATLRAWAEYCCGVRYHTWQPSQRPLR